ncbi:hypothetical protein TNCV_3884911 [Trichonephila clavipes]|nr:hypothetical protein TNCV_3884911 [Trichonephila clavipes]
MDIWQITLAALNSLTRKGSQEKTNTYTNTVNSIVRPGTSYSQAASASNSTKTHQMAPQVKGTPAALVTNQAN